jgi:hypothetical protein
MAELQQMNLRDSQGAAASGAKNETNVLGTENGDGERNGAVLNPGADAAFPKLNVWELTPWHGVVH